MKTVTGTAAATPSLSILVEALTAANLTSARVPCRDSSCTLSEILPIMKELVLVKYVIIAQFIMHAVQVEYSWSHSAKLSGSWGFAETLDDPKLVASVFAPTNDAFAALLKKLNFTKVGSLLGGVYPIHYVVYLRFLSAGGPNSLGVTAILCRPAADRPYIPDS